MTAMPTSGGHPITAANGSMRMEYEYTLDHGTSLSSPHKIHERESDMAPDDSAEGQINIFAGGWDDEDDEDYTMMAPADPNRSQSKPQVETPNSSPRINVETGGLVVTKSNDSGYYDAGNAGKIYPPSQKEILPAVVILPASPHGSMNSHTSAASHSPAPSAEGSESSESSVYSSEGEFAVGSDENRSLTHGEESLSSPTPQSDEDSKSGRDKDKSISPHLEQNRRDESMADDLSGNKAVASPLPLDINSKSTIAGQAARRYLQLQVGRSNSRSSYDRESPKSTTGLQRSSSRAGAGGVQSRISKNRQAQLATSPTRSVEDFAIDSPAEPVKLRHDARPMTRSASDQKINEDKRKSRTLDRDLSGTMLNNGIQSQQSLENLGDPENLEDALEGEGKSRSRDGAAVMRMITDRRKSRSLDSKYLQYLDGIARHASTSSPSSPAKEEPENITVSKTGNSSKKTAKTKKKNKKKEQKEEDDDEEEYRKYAAIMSAKSRSNGKTSMIALKSLNSSLPRTSTGLTERNLSDFASMHSREKSKAEKLLKKQQAMSVAQKLSFRKSKTLGKATTELKVQANFAQSAQAFHDLLTKKNENHAKIDTNAEANGEVKSNSLKREKRKSWKMKRHGLSLRSRSKDRVNSDSSIQADGNTSRPASPLNNSAFFTEESEPKSRNSRKQTPVIKQSLGYNSADSPTFRANKNADDERLPRRVRATSCDQSTPEHSPKIMSPQSGSMTLDRRLNAISDSQLVRVNSSGQLGVHNLLKSVNSFNSENSGSNSDISIQLEDEFDDRRGRSGGKSGTLSRLLGRKMKERRFDYGDYDDPDGNANMTGSLGRVRKSHGKYATLGSPSRTLRLRHAHSREMLLEAAGFSKQDRFFDKKAFVRGFRVSFSDDDEEEKDVAAEFELAFKLESTRNSKYATITGSRTTAYGNPDVRVHKKRASDTVIAEDVTDGNAAVGRRKQSMPVSIESGHSRGKPSKGTRRSVKGPSSHLPFNEALTEDEVVQSTDRTHMSPLRTRKIQAVEPLLEEPSTKISTHTRIIYRRLLETQPDLLRTHDAGDEKDQDGTHHDSAIHETGSITSYPSSILGQELVTWLMSQVETLTSGQESNEAPVSIMASWTRWNISGMLQALLEEGAICHVRKEHHFQDTILLYQFHESVTRNDDVSRPVSVESTVSSSTINSDNQSSSADTESQNNLDQQSDDASRRVSRNSSTHSTNTTASDRWGPPPHVGDQELKDTLSYLHNIAPDAMFRMVLRKLPYDRNEKELMMIYEEILHIKALAHLSDSVKRELAGVLKFEFHRKRGKTLFSQGDEGRSWYIIVKGSVDVDIQGQGVVCTLHEGDDFGNLAIINDAPRAATIVLAEDNCQLLRVDKHDFVRILKDVEANTVRLKEHDKDVLILQKIHARSASGGRQEKSLNNAKRIPPVAATPTRHNHKYAISAGTPAKIVDHIVKSLRPWSTARQSDEAMEDLILMYQVFMSTQELCKQLMKQYHSEQAEQIDATKSIKRKVVYFVVRWSYIATHIFYDQPSVGPFLKELKQAVVDDSPVYPNLKEDLARICPPESSPSESPSHRGWITVDSTTVQRYPQTDTRHRPHRAIKASDDVMLKVYNANGTYTTVRLPIISTVNEIISAVAEKQGRASENLLLIQVQSDGDMYVLPKNMTSAATSVGVNGRFFICSPDEKDDIEPLDEQHILPSTNSSVLELISSQEIAEHITQFDWELINSIHVMEFVHKVFGSHKFHNVTSNIDVFARRFNQLAYWAPTEICACNNLNKRVHLLRKFIKIAQHLKELQNMNAFMAVIIGLGNQALSRLHGTWDKLPTKYKKMMTEFEAILDPSRNHRAYRLYVANLRPPLIPYLPLLMKDMTFQHEGNDSTRNGLVNFEKMHMMSNSIRGVIQACSKPLEPTPAVLSSKTFEECRQYCRNFNVVTDQKFLNQLSAKVEPKR